MTELATLHTTTCRKSSVAVQNGLWRCALTPARADLGDGDEDRRNDRYTDRGSGRVLAIREGLSETPELVDLGTPGSPLCSMPHRFCSSGGLCARGPRARPGRFLRLELCTVSPVDCGKHVNFQCRNILCIRRRMKRREDEADQRWNRLRIGRRGRIWPVVTAFAAVPLRGEIRP